ncbi:hypothetical protein PM082_018727 [Marasmius tenuissimus]|nr:hypothetical protein PM082_018727 [Marasmius tenuissimus]
MLPLPSSHLHSIIIVLFCAFIGHTYSQALPSTSSFRKPNITISQEDLQTVSAAAIDLVVRTDRLFLTSGALPTRSWPYGDLLVEMAQYDLFSSQAKYKDIVWNFYIPTLQDLGPDREVRLASVYDHDPCIDIIQTLRPGINSCMDMRPYLPTLLTATKHC